MTPTHCHCDKALTIADDGIWAVLALVGPWLLISSIVWGVIWYQLWKMWRR